MRRALKWLGKLLLGILVIAMVAVTAGLGYRAWQHRIRAPLYEIAAPEGIDEARYVEIDGAAQWITIRGQDRRNPVILIVHGGPGAPMGMFAGEFLPWERDFVVVQWDQPGAGRTFRAAGRRLDPDLTIERMAELGNRLAEHLIDYLDADRIVVLGWSWGSVLGVHMVKTRPDLYSIYVGTGQVVNIPEGEAIVYADVLAKAERRGDRNAIAELEQIGPPPYASMQEMSVQRKWALAYETGQSLLTAFVVPALWEPRMTLTDIYDALAGTIASTDQFFGPDADGPIFEHDLRDLGPRFEVPMFIVQGADDDYTPASVAREFIDFVEAPDKGYFPIAGAGHFAIVHEGGQFLDLVRTIDARTRR